MKKILKDEDVKNKDLYELISDFKEELKECNTKEEKYQLYLNYLGEFKSIAKNLKGDDYIYKYTIDELDYIKTRLLELYTGFKFADSKKVEDSEIESLAKLQQDLKQGIYNFFTSLSWEPDEIEDFTILHDITEKNDRYYVLVGAEVDYETLSNLCDALDKVIVQYDDESYFEPEAPGLISAYVKKFEVKDSQTVKDINPRKGELKEDFISRFMEETKEEYPDQKQRLAVAYSYWNKNKKSTKDEDINKSLNKNGNQEVETNNSEKITKDNKRRVVVQPHSGSGADGFNVYIYEGNKLINEEEYRYGYNASHSRQWASFAHYDAIHYGMNEKPYTKDILEKVAEDNGLSLNELEFIDGKYIFSGRVYSANEFKTKYLNDSLNEVRDKSYTTKDSEFSKYTRNTFIIKAEPLGAVKVYYDNEEKLIKDYEKIIKYAKNHDPKQDNPMLGVSTYEQTIGKHTEKVTEGYITLNDYKIVLVKDTDEDYVVEIMKDYYDEIEEMTIDDFTETFVTNKEKFEELFKSRTEEIKAEKKAIKEQEKEKNKQRKSLDGLVVYDNNISVSKLLKKEFAPASDDEKSCYIKVTERLSDKNELFKLVSIYYKGYAIYASKAYLSNNTNYNNNEKLCQISILNSNSSEINKKIFEIDKLSY